MAREQEAEKATTAFHMALTYMGFKTLEEALALWDSTSPGDAARVSAAWLDDAVAMILSRRTMSRDLAVAYYRLVRALHTGSTVPQPGDNRPPETITLDVLRREFRELAEGVVERKAPPKELAPQWMRTGLEGETFPNLNETEGNDEEIPVDTDDDFPDDSDKYDRNVEDIVRTELEEVVTSLWDKRQEREARKRRSPEWNDTEHREEALRVAADRQGAIAQRAVADAGRGQLFDMGGRDSKALGYVRVSKTGNPCYFCAMLMSRQAVYKSQKGGTFDRDGNKYHENCQCIAVPIFSDAQYKSDRFALNRELNALWNKHIRGKQSGEDALSEWRKVIREWHAQRAA